MPGPDRGNPVCTRYSVRRILQSWVLARLLPAIPSPLLELLGARDGPDLWIPGLQDEAVRLELASPARLSSPAKHRC